MKKYSKSNKTKKIQMEIKYKILQWRKKYRNGNKMDMRLHV